MRLVSGADESRTYLTMGYLGKFQWLFELRNSREIVGDFFLTRAIRTRSNYTTRVTEDGDASLFAKEIWTVASVVKEN